MCNKLFNFATKKQGFTLVELMVVLLITGILMIVSLPVFLGARTRAQDNVSKQVLANAARAAAAYYVNEGQFPASMDEVEGAYNYVNESDGQGAPAFSDPPSVAYDTDNAQLRVTSQSGKVWVIDISNGEVGPITEEP